MQHQAVTNPTHSFRLPVRRCLPRGKIVGSSSYSASTARAQPKWHLLVHVIYLIDVMGYFENSVAKPATRCGRPWRLLRNFLPTGQPARFECPGVADGGRIRAQATARPPGPSSTPWSSRRRACRKERWAGIGSPPRRQWNSFGQCADAGDEERLGHDPLAGRRVIGLLRQTVIVELPFLIDRRDLLAIPDMAKMPLLPGVQQNRWPECGGALLAPYPADAVIGDAVGPRLAHSREMLTRCVVAGVMDGWLRVPLSAQVMRFSYVVDQMDAHVPAAQWCA